MGTYINLSIVPSNISNFEWEEVYEESLNLLNAFDLQMLKDRCYLDINYRSILRMQKK
ncbi:hypothetical protein AM1BK_41660 [Neobacillus kokaensis]|uniref:Uncharacterized protein n=1 Tax=Neobacillus kokaensis TaxID=2759023 RepID=A0ABQ3N9W0_9BACI|nr:hypothetical protein AM1BK_41660 [Neobacillus kokaensis]